jgi:hypothetical protein
MVMVKLCYAHLFILTILIFSNGMIFSMNLPFKPLNWVEREILLKVVKRVEIESMLEESTPGQTLSDADSCINFDIEKYPCPLEVKLKFYCKSPADVVTKIIFEAIALKEQKLAAKVEEVKVGRAKNLNQPDNYLGDYTRYWYETDNKGPHISCVSIFTNKAVLAEALSSLKKKEILEEVLSHVQHGDL